MTRVRRIYLYLVTLVALATLAVGVANLLRALLETWLGTPSALNRGYLQDQVALWGAAAAVGLPIWLAHWVWASRLAARDPVERASALRRLFLYVVLTGAVSVAWAALDEILPVMLTFLTSGSPGDLATGAVPPLPLVFVAAGVWAYHWRITSRDRRAVGESGASATLRRWYFYGVATVAAFGVLGALQMMVMTTWLLLTSSTPTYAVRVAGAHDALIAVALWMMHWSLLPRRLDAASRLEDRRSTLRSVYLFLVQAVVLIGTLSGISQAIYYALARVLGVSEPGGVGGSLVRAAAGPASVALVYGAGWICQRRMLRGLQRDVEQARQIGVRRTYEYLTALVALAVLAVGLSGLLWMLGDVLTNAPNTLGTDWWRDRLSLFATLTSVGLPVWLLHWHARRPAEARSLARRIYLYVTLIGAVLASLASGSTTVYRLLLLALGSAQLSSTMVELSHAMAVLLVAVAVSAYHWRMVRHDTQTTGLAAPVAAITPATALVEVGAPSAAALEAALEGLRAQGLTVRRASSAA